MLRAYYVDSCRRCLRCGGGKALVNALITGDCEKLDMVLCDASGCLLSVVLLRQEYVNSFLEEGLKCFDDVALRLTVWVRTGEEGKHVIALREVRVRSEARIKEIIENIIGKGYGEVSARITARKKVCNTTLTVITNTLLSDSLNEKQASNLFEKVKEIMRKYRIPKITATIFLEKPYNH